MEKEQYQELFYDRQRLVYEAEAQQPLPSEIFSPFVESKDKIKAKNNNIGNKVLVKEAHIPVQGR